MVNPGGTGTPMLVISARLAPLPPSKFFISLLPSALPPPKKKIRLFEATVRPSGLVCTPLVVLVFTPFDGLALILALALTLAVVGLLLLVRLLREGIVGGCLSGTGWDEKPGL